MPESIFPPVTMTTVCCLYSINIYFALYGVCLLVTHRRTLVNKQLMNDNITMMTMF